MTSQPVILSVEDNADLRALIRVWLSENGYTVLEAEDGIQGLQMAVAARPRLILMDLQLPHVSGMDTAKAIKAVPELADVPIIAVTGFALSGDRDKVLAAGFTDYLAKPFDLDDLLATVRKHLRP